MFFRQIYEPGLAHASYMIGCQATGEVLVIDAKRDIDTYVDIARQEKLRITHLAETHIHADFLSGTRELADVTGAMMYLSDAGGPEWQYEFDHVGLADGDSFMVGNIKIDVLHTPGHTPEHISFLATDTPASTHVPIMIFTGDFVFVGDVGRPDLLEKAAGYTGTMEIGARQMWKSLERFKALPDHIQVHPAHGAGSACGKALGAIPSSTVGYEKLVNWALRHTNEEQFVAELLSGQPEPPAYFAHMKKLNKVVRPLRPTLKAPPRRTADDVRAHMALGHTVVDTRSKVSFAGGHIPGSLNIQNNKAFSTWAGWMLNYEEPFIVVARESDVDDIVRKLARIGLDAIDGFIDDVAVWSDAGGALSTVSHMSVDELLQRYDHEGVTVIDVRGASEYGAGHIPGAWNIHAGYLRHYLADIPEDGVVVVSCQAGDRSSIATSLLLRDGRTNVVNFPPGYAGWIAAHAPVSTELDVRERA
ncbi:MAG: rhodanese-like domain-containing protein [Candidatus Kapabacteria bacterium]|jgi:hydroxyacylglutathione hydrolase|nr:rhodanese-like domain-containing protein [Candidatus Kapabacteria bacterium]